MKQQRRYKEPQDTLWGKFLSGFMAVVFAMSTLTLIPIASAINGEPNEAQIQQQEELADQTTANEEALKELNEQLDELTESLDVLETLVVDSFEDEEDEYEVECPNCGGAILLDGDTLESGVVTCPACEKKFQIDLGFE